MKSKYFYFGYGVGYSCWDNEISICFYWIPAFAGMTEGELDSRFRGDDRGGNQNHAFAGMTEGESWIPVPDQVEDKL